MPSDAKFADPKRVTFLTRRSDWSPFEDLTLLRSFSKNSTPEIFKPLGPGESISMGS